MTKKERYKVWMKMTPEQRQEAQRRKDDLVRRQTDELDDKYDELVAQGTFDPGIGKDPDEINDMKKRHIKEIIALQHEYGLA